jgi:hypothetical protein
MKESKLVYNKPVVSEGFLICECAHNRPEEGVQIDYHALGISPPMESTNYNWKPALFAIDVIDFAITMHDCADGTPTFMIRVQDMSFIIKGKVEDFKDLII